MSYLGEIAALLTALCWLGSSVAFAVAGRAAGAQPLNQFRLYAALPLLFAVALIWTGRIWPSEASAERVWLLAFSGVFGLVVGDYGFFHALATIGPRLSSVIMALWPACTVAIDAVRGRYPSGGELAGVGLTVTGVALVLLRRGDGAWRPGLTRRQWLGGVLGAFIGALGQSSGFVMAGIAMEAGPDLEAGIDPLLATIVRMVAATLGMQLVVVLQRQPLAMVKILQHRQALAMAMLGVVCGPVLGVWLSMVGRRLAENPGVAAALMATTPVFMLPVSVWLYRARVGWLSLVGTLLAVAGVAVCFVQSGG